MKRNNWLSFKCPISLHGIILTKACFQEIKINLLIGLICGVIGFNIFITPSIEKSVTFYPIKEINQTPTSKNIDYKDIYLTTADNIKINGWYIDNPSSNEVILFLHGNGGNIQNTIGFIDYFYQFPIDFFVIDYHGYGKSGGELSEANLYLDTNAAYNYLINDKKYSPKQIILVGWSLGANLALNLASKEQVGAVVSIASITSAKEISDHFIPFYIRPFIWERSNFNVINIIDKITAPILFMHSKNDNLIPYNMSLALYEKANKPKYLIPLNGGNHSTLELTPEITNKLKYFILNKKLDLP